METTNIELISIKNLESAGIREGIISNLCEVIMISGEKFVEKNKAISVLEELNKNLQDVLLKFKPAEEESVVKENIDLKGELTKEKYILIRKKMFTLRKIRDNESFVHQRTFSSEVYSYGILYDEKPDESQKVLNPEMWGILQLNGRDFSDGIYRGTHRVMKFSELDLFYTKETKSFVNGFNNFKATVEKYGGIENIPIDAKGLPLIVKQYTQGKLFV